MKVTDCRSNIKSAGIALKSNLVLLVCSGTSLAPFEDYTGGPTKAESGQG